VRLWDGDPLPSLPDLAGVIAMGGPMSVNDTGRHAWIEPEVELLGSALGAGLPVLGICLGAQLVARSLGSAVRPAGREEVGVAPIELADASGEDPLLAPCGDRITAFHWHGETFDVPPGRPSLARTDACPNQAFRAGERAWALQFHIEVDGSLAEAWRPLLPRGGGLDEPAVTALAREGRPVLRRFFELAAGG
jgi:GMP synthase-like glutamine amidotransferase